MNFKYSLALLFLSGTVTGPGFSFISTTPEPLRTQKYWALLVGIDQYEDATIPNLQSAVKDAERMQQLLIHVYGFSPANVTLLKNEDATLDAFLQSFEHLLKKDIHQNDSVVIFFSGHGSRVMDLNEYEPHSELNPKKPQGERDRYDETLCFHDARDEFTDFARGQLLDDTFHVLLQRLYQKTKKITVILDTCFAGTATRGRQIRFVPTRIPQTQNESIRPQTANPNISVAIDPDYTPEDFPEMVLFAATGEGQLAFENADGGLFTNEMLTILGHMPPADVTFQKVANSISARFNGVKQQKPVFEGPLDQPMFFILHPPKPGTWTVTEVLGNHITIQGPPLAHLNTGATFSLFSSADPQPDSPISPLPKALATVTHVTGLVARAELESKTITQVPVPGDVAILTRPGSNKFPIHIRLRPPQDSGGLTPKIQKAFCKALQAHDEAQSWLRIVPSENAFDFEISLENKSMLAIWDAFGERRCTLPMGSNVDFEHVQKRLKVLAQIRAMATWRGSDNSQLTDDQTLSIRCTPAFKEKVGFSTSPSKSHHMAVVPYCEAWFITVSLAKDAPGPLYIAGFVLSGDGTMIPLPSKGPAIKLQPGQSWRFQQKIRSLPPMTAEDRVFMLGMTQPLDMRPFAKASSRSRGDFNHADPSNLFSPSNDNDTSIESRNRGGRTRSMLKTAWTVSQLSLQGAPSYRLEKVAPGPLTLRDGFPSLSESAKPISAWGALWHAIHAYSGIAIKHRFPVWQVFFEAGFLSKNEFERGFFANRSPHRDLDPKGFSNVTHLGTLAPGDLLIFSKKDRMMAFIVLDPWNKITWGIPEWRAASIDPSQKEPTLVKDPLAWLSSTPSGHGATFHGIWRHANLLDTTHINWDWQQEAIIANCRQRLSIR